MFLLFAITVNAQNPSNDKSWKLDASKSDEFNGTVIDFNKWKHHPDWGTCWHDSKNKYYTNYSSDNYFIKDGVLTLKLEKEKCTCYHIDKQYIQETGSLYKTYNANYTQGALFSYGTYNYGYFEMRCILPNREIYKGINPCFWLYEGKSNSEGKREEWHEIDIFEFNGYRDKHTCNVHYLDKSMIPNYIPKGKKEDDYRWQLRHNDEPYYDFDVNFNSYHTFACEWTPDYINFYYDDKLVRSTNVSYCSKLKPMFMLITTEAFDGKFDDSENNVSQNFHFPYEWKIDYVRYYTPKMDCNKVVNQSNFNFSTFDYAVKKSITLKNTTVPQNSKYTLRATDYMELQGVFEIPLGSELTLMPTPKY